jgi:hypothetical protein
MTEKKSTLELFSQLGAIMKETADQYESETDAWWKSLSMEEQERAFFSVVKRIYQGEIVDRGSYRYVLYEVFGFGPEAYSIGMECGYLELHNAIYTHEEMNTIRDIYRGVTLPAEDEDDKAV